MRFSDVAGTTQTPPGFGQGLAPASNRLASDWQSFDVAADERVRFNRPSSTAAALNRILNENPSQIFGAVEANARMFLLNASGIVVGRGSTFDVGVLFATSMQGLGR